MEFCHVPISHKQVRKLHTNVGMVFQQFNLFPHLSVLDNHTGPRRVLGKSKQESEKQARFYLDKVGLAEKRVLSDQLLVDKSNGDRA